MSELELSLLRARSMEALKQKARRGELFFTVAVGYVKVGRDKIEMDPDLRVREAIGLVFTRFASAKCFCRFEVIRSRCRTSTPKSLDIRCCGSFRSTRR